MAAAHLGAGPGPERGRADGEPTGCPNDAPCPPRTSHGASLRQPVGPQASAGPSRTQVSDMGGARGGGAYLIAGRAGPI
eukprot:COSAG01_NODE_3839_length_5646_cov_8.715934_9_plen_79_part_00